jgi:HAE1 family hydrophobic/amphiphilic exporter-1
VIIKKWKYNNDFVKELNKRELSNVFSFFSASFPQYMMKVDNDLAQQRNIYWNAMNTLSTLVEVITKLVLLNTELIIK